MSCQIKSNSFLFDCAPLNISQNAVILFVLRMRMVRKFIAFVFSVSLLFSLLTLAEKKSNDELPEKYKKWLDEDVVYIISSPEKDVFLQLETDRERELFIEAFWKQRDPTPATPENEFKNEHYRRINYANYTFGRGVPKPGWRTDRGRIYIILGEPQDIERFTGEAQIYNSEIWFYQGLSKYGLPAGFNLVFFQKGGIGEYVLYSPTNDGPQALLTSYFGDQANYLATFRALKKINPSLARVSLTLIPGESVSFGRPSLASDILIQNVLSVPQKQIKDKYAEKFLMYKDIVEVDYSANYIDNDSSVRIIKDSTSGLFFVHYVVELTKFSVQQYQEKYSTHLEINGKVANLEGKTVYQYEGSFSIEFDKAKLESITYRPFDLYDMFPLLPGRYKFSVIIKNDVSKEFTTVEEEITVPESESEPRMSSLILGYKMDHVSSALKELRPFTVGSNQIYHQPKNIFHPEERLFLGLQILGLKPKQRHNGVLTFGVFKGDESFYERSKGLNEYLDRVNFVEEFPLQKFPPGHYRIKVAFLDGERELLTEQDEFDITSASAMPRPWVYYKKLSPPEDPVYAYILGRQHLSRGETEKAKGRFEEAYRKKPDSLEYAFGLAQACFSLRNYVQTRQILLPFSGSEKTPYQVYFLLGKSRQALGEYDEAISTYQEAMSRYGINIVLLNSLGECYDRLGLMDEALAAWEKSLEMNPDQPEIKVKIENIKKFN